MITEDRLRASRWEKRAAELHRLSAYVNNLCPRQRLAFVRRSEGATYEGIAAELQTTAKTAEYVYYCAIKSLKRLEKTLPAKRESEAEIIKHIEALPEGRLKRVATLYYVERMRYRDIGKQIGRCAQTVYEIICEFKAWMRGQSCKQDKDKRSRMRLLAIVTPKLDQLTERRRKVVLMRLRDGKQFRDIGAEIGLSATSAHYALLASDQENDAG